MLTIEKKIYAVIDKYLHFIIAFFVAGVVLFMNRQTLYCFRPYEGADMWEASKVFVHSPMYVFFVRKVWIELFNGNYDLYHKLFWPFTYSVAFLGATIFHFYKSKVGSSHTIVNTFIFFCFALITPLALLYGPVMLHMDGISMTLILVGILLEKCFTTKMKWFPLMIGFTLAISLQTNYIFCALILIIYGLIKKEKKNVCIPLAGIIFSLILNILIGIYMGFSGTESIYMIFRFFYISQGTGTIFSSVFSWILYMIFWNGYWIGMFFLFVGFAKPKKAPVCILGHIILFFLGITIFFNGYIS